MTTIEIELLSESWADLAFPYRVEFPDEDAERIREFASTLAGEECVRYDYEIRSLRVYRPLTWCWVFGRSTVRMWVLDMETAVAISFASGGTITETGARLAA